MSPKKLLFHIFLFLNLNVFSQDLVWESRPAIPNFGREGHAGFMLNGKLYTGLGLDAYGNGLNDFWEYDPATKAWTRKADFPAGGRVSPISFAINGKGYVGMGRNSFSGLQNSDLYEYNPVNDAWTQKASFIGGGREASTSIVVDNIAYIGLGSCGSPTCYNQDWYKYVPSSNTWSKLASWPGGKVSGAQAFAIGNYIYVGVGLYDTYINDNSFYRYNTTTNTWAAIPDLPGPARRTSGTFTYKNEGYVGCGTYSSIPTTSQLNDFYKYSALTNNWTKVSVNDEFASCTNIRFFNSGDSLLLGVGGATTTAKLANVWHLQLKKPSSNADTSRITIYDTTYITIYDTNYTVIKTAVDDTLNVYLYASGGGCGDISIKIYPNPTTYLLNLHINKPACYEGSKVEIVDQLGRILQTKPLENSVLEFDIQGYARELYFLRMVGKDGKTLFTKKFVIH